MVWFMIYMQKLTAQQLATAADAGAQVAALGMLMAMIVTLVDAEVSWKILGAGLAVGDRVAGLDGLTIYAWRDFEPDPSRSDSTVFVRRDGLRGVHALRWPHEATTQAADPLELTVFVLLGLLFAWISPLALSVRPHYAQIPRTAWAARLGLVAAFSSLMLFVPTLQWATMWILGLGTFAALFALGVNQFLGLLVVSVVAAFAFFAGCLDMAVVQGLIEGEVLPQAGREVVPQRVLIVGIDGDGIGIHARLRGDRRGEIVGRVLSGFPERTAEDRDLGVDRRQRPGTRPPSHPELS